MKFSTAFLFCLVLIAPLFTGCAAVGPSSIHNGRLLYNEAIQTTSEQELLLNIVRLRYGDTPTILQIANIATQLNLEARVSPSASILPAQADRYNLGLSGAYYERPTISYRPVVGQSFIQLMLEPISQEKLTLLYNAGWPVDTLFALTVQSISGIQNAPGATGPSPEVDPDFRRFQRLTRAMRDLQRAGLLMIGRRDKTSQLRIEREKEHAPQLDFILKTLDLQPSAKAYTITQATDPGNRATIAVVPRSLMSTMFHLSQGVQVPDGDVESGRVFTAQSPTGQARDWQEAISELFQVQVSYFQPKDFSVAVKYRRRWFYIRDRDLQSKTTFALLNQLVAMQAGNVRYAGPVLTLPVGGN